jgi:hypothetical protein
MRFIVQLSPSLVAILVDKTRVTTLCEFFKMNIPNTSGFNLVNLFIRSNFSQSE